MPSPNRHPFRGLPPPRLQPDARARHASDASQLAFVADGRRPSSPMLSMSQSENAASASDAEAHPASQRRLTMDDGVYTHASRRVSSFADAGANRSASASTIDGSPEPAPRQPTATPSENPNATRVESRVEKPPDAAPAFGFPTPPIATPMECPEACGDTPLAHRRSRRSRHGPATRRVPLEPTWPIVADERSGEPVRVGPYELFGRIGSGQVGTVYTGILDDEYVADEDGAATAADALGNSRSVNSSSRLSASPNHVPLPTMAAIKIQPRRRTPYTADGTAPREAWALAQLAGHPHVTRLVACVDEPEQSDSVALVMALVDGAAPLLAEAPPAAATTDDQDGSSSSRRFETLAPAEARAAAQQLLSALAACERRHIVHGDLKPDNILATRDFALPPPRDCAPTDTLSGCPPALTAADSNDGSVDPAIKCLVIDFGAAHLHRTRAELPRSADNSGCFDVAVMAGVGSNVVASVTNDDIDAETLARHLVLDGGVASAQRLYNATEASFAQSINFGSPDISPQHSPTAAGGTLESLSESESASTTVQTTTSTLAGSLRPRHLFKAQHAGAPMYTAPEVLAGGARSSASDLFSLGIVLFTAACGSLPYPPDAADGESLQDRARAWLRLIFGLGPLPATPATATVTPGDDTPIDPAVTDLPAPIVTPRAPMDPMTLPGVSWSPANDLPLVSASPSFAERVASDSATAGPCARMTAALVARGLDAEAWDVHGRGAWLPALLVRLLHPEPFFRGCPSDLLEDLDA